MSNGRKKLSATFASAILVAASALVATPAPAQYGPGPVSEPYCCNVNGCGWGTLSGPGWGYDCCYYDGYRWYSLHVWGTDDCYIYPPYQSPDEAGDRVSQEQAGQ